MVGLGFAAVPLYRIFCQQTGFGGTARIEEGAKAPGDTGRIVTVRFDANISNRLPWRFAPEQKTQRVAIGARQLAFFDATNLSDRPITAAAAFNISPDQSAAYFVKIQCFCFTQQTLQPGETQRMPVVFYVDPAFLRDRDNAGVTEITLSYTFYPVDQKPAEG
ncbi:cytochrome c oxidase assembly protein [Sphingomonas abietis]|uniref:Cytochrome c oxidase assembly protein CtaG n=1 Tax=Sphingomonas abietis TaxID=3012344 RepID=A0ABY7NX84_9SPHN|nr:cytochrome c oxidase assembly protein [Sphingomonas abietis]WBO24524.1 cytochrome c oxidase assembly protein [Sphingomonas abietis]